MLLGYEFNDLLSNGNTNFIFKIPNMEIPNNMTVTLSELENFMYGILA